MLNLNADDDNLLKAMSAICKKPGNPVAWIVLHDVGLTREVIAKTAEGGNWAGPKPDFDSYPDDKFFAAYRKLQAREASQ